MRGQRIESSLFLPARPGGVFVERAVKIDHLDWEEAQRTDASPRASGNHSQLLIQAGWPGRWIGRSVTRYDTRAVARLLLS
jgi:hypothetical protein